MSDASWLPSADSLCGNAWLTDWLALPRNVKPRPAFEKPALDERKLSEVPPRETRISTVPFREIPPMSSNAPSPVEKEPYSLAEEVDHRLGLLSSAMNEIMDFNNREIIAAAGQVLELGMVVAEQLAAGAIDIDRKRMLDLVEESIEMLGDDRAVRVRIHPDIHKELELNGLLDRFENNPQFSIRPDPSVEELGCIVESDERRIDAGVHSRLSKLRHLISGWKGAQS